ncbi:MAG: N-acetyltransferase family protein, partial [Solirubrobacteraceae bacterium]
SAEVTVAVAEAWQGRGIATALLERVAASARAADIKQLTARCLAGDDTLIRVLSRLGPTTIEPSRAGLVSVRIDLAATAPPGP